MDFKITRFGGLMPKVHAQDLSTVMAQECLDVDLSRGILSPFRTDKLIFRKPVNSFWTNGCCLAASANCRTSWAIAHCGALVATELDGIKYPVIRQNPCNGDWVRLSFPLDLVAPSVQVIGHVREDFNREIRQYVYTLVNQFGESAPSNVSDVVVTDNDLDVVLSGIPTTFDGYSVDSIRVYCAVSGLDYGAEKTEKQADFLMVGEISVDAGVFIHKAHTIYQDLLVVHSPVSDCLVSVCSAGNGQLGGIVGCELWLSEPLNPTDWNEKYRYGNFKGQPVRFLANENIGYVLTTANPAIVFMNDAPSDVGCREIKIIEETLPIISFQSACLYAGACFYASKNGLVMIAGDLVRVISLDFWTAEQWQTMKPWTLRGVVHDGWYFGTTDTVTFRFKIPDNIHDKAEIESLTHLSIQAAYWFRADNGRLFYGNAGGVYEWNVGNAWKSFVWRSRLNVVGGYTAWSAYKLAVDFAPIHVTHTAYKYHRGQLVREPVILGDKQIYDSRPNRLKAGFSSVEIDVEMRGTGQVHEYHLATSVAELGTR